MEARFVKISLAVVLVLIALGRSVSAFQPMLPDPKLTPGKIAAGDRDRGGVTDSLREKVFVRYHIAPDRRGAFKIDHLIPAELGGADTIDNLWPQKINARPYTARRKEVLARTLLDFVAAGKMTLAEAQTEIREDWISSFIIHIGMVYLEPGAKHRESE